MKRLITRLLVATIALATALLMGTAGLVGLWLAGVHVPLAFGETYMEIVEMDGARSAGEPDDGLLFIALIGNDYRPGVGGARGDALHLVGINVAEKTGTMIDIPRDVCYAGGKINAQNSYGGVRGQADALGDVAGVAVDYAVGVDFAGFTGIVDDMGGVTVDVLEPHDDHYSGAVFAAGENHMSGAQALAFSRNRHDWPTGDIKRTENQGHLILAGLAQLQSQMDDPVGKFKVMSSLVRHAELDGLAINDIFRLGEVAFALDANSIRNVALPVFSGGCSGGLSPSGEAAPLLADFADDAILQAH